METLSELRHGLSNKLCSVLCSAALVILEAALGGKSPSKVLVIDKGNKKMLSSFEVPADVQHPIIMP